MAKINVKDTVDHPRKLVYETFRDDLIELVPHLPDIKDIEVEDRERIDDDTLKVVNLWKAKDEEVPTIARKFIKPEMLQWTDHATWHDDEWTCDWNMEVGFLTEAITAKGTNTYTERDGSTQITIDGVLEVDAKKIPGVPGMLAGRVGKAVENFVVKMITPNLKDVNRGMEKYLAAQED